MLLDVTLDVNMVTKTICIPSVGSGSLLCWAIDPRPISYLEHCKPIERKIYDQSNITLCLATSWEPCVMQFPTDLLTLLCEELSCSSERWSKTCQKRARAREMGVIHPPSSKVSTKPTSNLIGSNPVTLSSLEIELWGLIWWGRYSLYIILNEIQVSALRKIDQGARHMISMSKLRCLLPGNKK